MMSKHHYPRGSGPRPDSDNSFEYSDRRRIHDDYYARAQEEEDRHPYRGRDPLPLTHDKRSMPHERPRKSETKGPVNDLQILETLKDRIKRGQHGIYRPIPQPSVLASLYLGSSSLIPDDSSSRGAPASASNAPSHHGNELSRTASGETNDMQKTAYQSDLSASSVRVKIEEDTPLSIEDAYRKYENKRPAASSDDRFGDHDKEMLVPDQNSLAGAIRPAAHANDADRQYRRARRDSNAHPYPRDGRHSFSHQRESRQEDFRYKGEAYGDRSVPAALRSAVSDVPPNTSGSDSHFARQQALPLNPGTDRSPLSGRSRALSPMSERDRPTSARETGQRAEESHLPPHLTDSRSMGDQGRGYARRTSVIRGGPPSPLALEARLANDRDSPPLPARYRVPLGERISDRAAPPSLQERLRADPPAARKNSALSLEERISSPIGSQNLAHTSDEANAGDRRPLSHRTGVPGDRYVPSPDHVPAATATATRLPPSMDAPRRLETTREPPYDGRDRYAEPLHYGDRRRDFSPPPPVSSGSNGRGPRGRSPPPRLRAPPSPPPLRRDSPPPRPPYHDPYAADRGLPYRPNNDYDAMPVDRDRYWQGAPSGYLDDHHLWSRAPERRPARSRSPSYYPAPARPPYGRPSSPPHHALRARSPSPMRGVARTRDDVGGYYAEPPMYSRPRSPVGNGYPPAGYARPRYDPRDDRGRYMPPPSR